MGVAPDLDDRQPVRSVLRDGRYHRGLSPQSPWACSSGRRKARPSVTLKGEAPWQSPSESGGGIEGLQ